jgi:hypothetical protein
MSDNQVKSSGVFLLAAILVVWGYLWMNQGYGEVSQQTYEFSKAIYGACLAKSEQRLDKIQNLLDDSSGDQLPGHERKWLEAIISNARAENWKVAAKEARSMMEDQAQSVN